MATFFLYTQEIDPRHTYTSRINCIFPLLHEAFWRLTVIINARRVHNTEMKVIHNCLFSNKLLFEFQQQQKQTMLNSFNKKILIEVRKIRKYLCIFFFSYFFCSQINVYFKFEFKSFGCIARFCSDNLKCCLHFVYGNSARCTHHAFIKKQVFYDLLAQVLRYFDWIWSINFFFTSNWIKFSKKK